MTTRFETALAIQDACNLSGVARELVRVIDDARNESGVNPRTDPAVILLLDKLWDMIGRPDMDRFSKAYTACADKVRETADFDTLLRLRLETDDHTEFDGHLDVNGSRYLARVRAFANERGEDVRKQLDTQIERLANYGRPWLEADDPTINEWEWRTRLYPDGSRETGLSFGWHAQRRKNVGQDTAWKTAMVGGLIWREGDNRWTVHT